jgi:hypothetical protein
MIPFGGDDMATSRQVGLRLDESDDMNLKRVAQMEGRSEQEVLRDSLRMYIKSVDEHQQFLDSVERGWYELRSGLGEVVTEDDQFFQSLREELKK